MNSELSLLHHKFVMKEGINFMISIIQINNFHHKKQNEADDFLPNIYKYWSIIIA